ncbi:MAG: protein-tyrosine phosphatase, partial [Actinomycetota bacterium]
ERGVDISSHVSRRLDRDMLADADLVLTMTRDHLREAVVTDPSAFPKIFTLRELVRRLDENPGASLASLNVGRSTSDYHGANPDDDVQDPIGQARRVYEATASELDGLLTTLVKSLENL